MELNEQDALSYVGKYCSILSKSGAGMSGEVLKIEDGWLIVNYGYGIRLEDIQEITEEKENEP